MLKVRLLSANMRWLHHSSALDAIFDQGDGGTIIVNNVFDPDTHKSGTTPAPAAVTVQDINGRCFLCRYRLGFSGAYECYNTLGYFTKIIIAHGYSPSAVVALRNGCGCHTAECHGDCRSAARSHQTNRRSKTRGASGIANTSSPRVILTYPHVLIEDTTGAAETRLDPLVVASGWRYQSRRISIRAGITARRTGDQGVVDLETAINFYPSDYQNDTNFLNEAGIVTAMRSFATGFRTFGNRSAAFPSSSHVENFIHARRILDMTHEAIIYYLMNYIDRIGTRANIEAVEEGVNAYLRTKIGDRRFLRCDLPLRHAKNTAAQIADGRFYYKFECHPISVMEASPSIATSTPSSFRRLVVARKEG